MTRPSGLNKFRVVAVHVVFFGSGIPALLYQIAWQRSLFVIFGTSIESVTAVVAAFLFGLGFGSLAGAIVSARWPNWPAPKVCTTS
jgi:predicted membrane-bound spermidine synthase